MTSRSSRSWVALLAVLGAAACEDDAATFNGYQCATPAAAEAPDNDTATTASTVSDMAWDETAVRQVLHVFAFGGFATDAQITRWADQPPATAIREIISFGTVNPALSPAPPDGLPVRPENGNLRCLAGQFSSGAPDNPVPPANRAGFAIDASDAVAPAWLLAVRLRGLNPVRQRVGFIETNYHMAVSFNAGVSNRQIAAYYDTITDDLARDLPYETVLTHAALSPVVAQQYNHRNNVYRDGRFYGNEDFGREYHQLFFGILGTYDDGYTGERADLHEMVSIPSTARALTDMQVPQETPRRDTITYGEAQHWQGPLQILESRVEGANARARLEALAPIAARHPESLANLPIILVRFLADDALDPDSADPGVQARVATVRALWAATPRRSLRTFLRRYAISTAFHNPGRVKYWTSVERNVLINNLSSLTNADAWRDVYTPRNWISGEDVQLFCPSHDVFGGQTGREAATTASVFAAAYNRSVDAYWSLTRTNDTGWTKDWSAAVPRGADGRFRVRATAEWLWQRYVADGIANLGPLERAHLYALLASGRDLASWIDNAAPEAVYTLEQVRASPQVRDTVNGAEMALIQLDGTNSMERQQANYRVSLAVNFIVATPFFMAQRAR